MTVPDVLEAAGWPVGSHGRTSCPLHGGQNPQAFSYTETQWFCFAGCGGGGVRRLAERLGVGRTSLPMVAPQGLGFVDAALPVRKRRRASVRQGRGMVTRRLADGLVMMDQLVTDEWEREHREALCAYRDWEDLLRLIEPSDFEFIAEELGHALERLEATHAHLRSRCPGDCYLRDDPRPRH